jgi:fucose permease
MVPLFAAMAQKLSARVSSGVLTAVGCVLFAVAVLLVGLRLTLTPSYASVVLPGMLAGGAGVGLALPTILSTATADLPAHSSATGSAVVNMSRQIGAVLGIAVLVAVLGTPGDPDAALDAFARSWVVIGGVSLLAAVVALGMTPRGDVGTKPAVAPVTAARAEA